MDPVRALRDLAFNAGRVARRAGARAALPATGGVWLTLPLSPDLGDFAQRRRIGGEESPGLLEHLRVLAAAADDPRVDGVLLDFRGGVPGFAAALALRRAVDEAREAGLRIVAWAEVLDVEDYLVASGADRVWLAPNGSLHLVGLQVEQLYLRDLLGHANVEADVVHVGRYKSAGEMVTRGSMSAEQREQLESWQGDLYEGLVDRVAAGRDLAPGAVEARIDRGPYGVDAAAEAGLVDGAMYRDEIDRAIEPLLSLSKGPRPGPRRPQWLEARVYDALHANDTGFRPVVREVPTLAYVAVQGAIHRGPGRRGVGSDVFGALLDGLRERSDVRGVVLRIDSPGGDAIASDLLYRSIERLRREKPVVASMGDVAASGGYYMAAAADRIFAERGTLTGSIGVVGGKLNLAGLYERLGVTKESVERGARAGMLSEARGFTPDERSAVRREMEAMYRTFLERVERGRSMPHDEVERVAAGRVWSGLRAAAVGLVDAVGGPLEALAEAGARAGLHPGERRRVETLPRGIAWPSLPSLLLGGGRGRAGLRPRPWL